MNKKDLRVVKTQNTLYTTLLELMKEKSFEELKCLISVVMLLLIVLLFMLIIMINMSY